MAIWIGEKLFLKQLSNELKGFDKFNLKSKD